eukprot:TRINITY_DN3182_c2_g1_i1.p3 TRINITY_DN3182_c2_g1~~TRINITY_DN3182_c2_g1_i1.p3  ORF type:complete len:129 (-),score=5.74 TRINITY_DN3182_c2_g1_i1:270-656(-)
MVKPPPMYYSSSNSIDQPSQKQTGGKYIRSFIFVQVTALIMLLGWLIGRPIYYYIQSEFFIPQIYKVRHKTKLRTSQLTQEEMQPFDSYLVAKEILQRWELENSNDNQDNSQRKLQWYEETDESSDWL